MGYIASLEQHASGDLLFLSRHKKSRQKKGAVQTPRRLGPRHLTLSGRDGGGNQGGTPAPLDVHYGTGAEGLIA